MEIKYNNILESTMVINKFKMVNRYNNSYLI